MDIKRRRKQEGVRRERPRGEETVGERERRDGVGSVQRRFVGSRRGLAERSGSLFSLGARMPRSVAKPPKSQLRVVHPPSTATKLKFN